VNGKYINDMIKISWSNDILINIVDAQKPLVLKDPDDNNYTYIVRPLLK
jgi:DNA polymerase III sliding clamp (beta) subunit (PCNA family)